MQQFDFSFFFLSGIKHAETKLNCMHDLILISTDSFFFFCANCSHRIEISGQHVVICDILLTSN